MAQKEIFSIADVRLLLTSRPPLTLPSRTSPYTGFDLAEPSGQNESSAVHTVRISDKRPTVPGDAREVFRTSTWSASRAGNRLLLRATERIPERYSWQACIEGATSSLFCPGESHDDSNRRHPFSYPTDQILLFHLFQRFDALLVHGVGFSWNGAGIVCVGKSGAGKSTLSRIVSPNGGHVLSDDRIVLRHRDGGHCLYGTPWPGDAGHARNEGAPLSHLLFLRQSDQDKIVPLAPSEASALMMPVCSIPWYDESAVTDYFRILDRIVRDIPCAELHFTKSKRVLDVLNRLTT